VRMFNRNFKSTVLTIIYNVETTYYDLLYQREQYKVQEEELRQAQQLLDENTIKRQTGVLTDLDVMQARAGVAAAQNQLILDEQSVHNSEDALLQLLGDRQFKSLVGNVDFPSIGEPDVSFERSYKLARDNGPNLAVAQATIDQFKLAALKAKRNTLPELNVNGGLGYNSYAATAGQSLTGSWNGYNWNAGVTVSIPGECRPTGLSTARRSRACAARRSPMTRPTRRLWSTSGPRSAASRQASPASVPPRRIPSLPRSPIAAEGRIRRRSCNKLPCAPSSEHS